MTSQTSNADAEKSQKTAVDHKIADTTPEEELAKIVAEELDADIIHYSGATFRRGADQLITKCIARRRRKNVVLILVTPGGDADSAYRIARSLHANYERFILYVSGYCKSAGTLIATGAHELVMSEYAELGPLDIQMSKRDELSESQSGLAVNETFMNLQHQALEAFVDTLMTIKRGSHGTVSLKMATEIATSMTTGLFAPIYGQIDPLHVGEAARAMNITSAYGSRLLHNGKNISEEALNELVQGYPSHGFVIDREEAKHLFKSVRPPSEAEDILAKALGITAILPVNHDDQELPMLEFLSPEPAISETEDNESPTTGGANEQSAHTTKYAPTGVAEDADPQPTENGSHEEQDLEALRTPSDDQASRDGV